MTRQFALLIALVSAVMLLAGCPPASLTDPGFFLTCLIDGVELTVTAGPSGSAPAPGGAPDVMMEGTPSGFVDYFSPTDTIVLASTSAVDMTAGNVSFPNQQGAFTCAFNGLTSTGSFAISSGETGGFMQFTTPDGLTTYTTSNVAATINGSITKFESLGGVIEGTFSGVLYDQPVGGTAHTITEGSFRIKIFDAIYYQTS